MGMLFANFNQDFTCVELSCDEAAKITQVVSSCISVGTRKGYSITNCDPFGRVYTMSPFQLLPYVLFTLHSQSNRRWGSRNRRNALLYIPNRASRCSGSATVQPKEVADCQHQGGVKRTSVRLGSLPNPFAAPVHDLRIAVPFLNTCGQTEPENPRHCSRSRDLHIRHFEYAPASCHRNHPKPGRYVV